MDNNRPYPNAAINQIYTLLFCDTPELLTPAEAGVADRDDAGLRIQAHDTSLESRHRLFAMHQLRRHGEAPNTGELLGVIIELGLDDGLDVLAVYRDGRARYLNYSGKVIVWEAPDTTLQEQMNTVFLLGQQIVDKIGPWEGPRKPPPATGQLRLSFLMDGNLYFGEGPINAMFNDAMAAPLLMAMTELMQTLVAMADQGQ